jgi:hypothetical protein
MHASATTGGANHMRDVMKIRVTRKVALLRHATVSRQHFAALVEVIKTFTFIRLSLTLLEIIRRIPEI